MSSSVSRSSIRSTCGRRGGPRSRRLASWSSTGTKLLGPAVGAVVQPRRVERARCRADGPHVVVGVQAGRARDERRRPPRPGRAGHGHVRPLEVGDDRGTGDVGDAERRATARAGGTGRSSASVSFSGSALLRSHGDRRRLDLGGQLGDRRRLRLRSTGRRRRWRSAPRPRPATGLCPARSTSPLARASGMPCSV